MLTELDPPKGFTYRGVGGLPVAVIARGTVEPLDGGRGSRVTLAMSFETHGIGSLILWAVVRPRVRKALPTNEQRLKALLEAAHR